MLYIKNGRIITPDGVVEGYALALNQKIEGIINVSDIPEGAETIDACGNYVAPGLVDIHIHGYLGEDASDGKPEGLKIIAEGIVKNGVTSFLPTTMTVSKAEIERAFNAARQVKEESRVWNGAEILGVHAEGPFINPDKKGAQAAEHILKPDAAFVLENADIVRLITLAPEMDDGHVCIKELAEKSDIQISMGHTGATFEEAMSAVSDGVNHATHLFNAMTPMLHRAPGVVGASFASDIYSELIADTFHVHPGLFSVTAKQKSGRLILITDSIRAGGLSDGSYELGGQNVTVQGIQCRLEDGTIAGSVLTLNRAVHNMLLNTKLPVHEVVNMASLNPAKAIHADRTKGSIKAGKDADIIIADGDFNILRTIKGGRTVFINVR